MMPSGMNNAGPIKGESDFVQVLKGTFYYLLFILIFTGLHILLGLKSA